LKDSASTKTKSSFQNGWTYLGLQPELDKNFWEIVSIVG
jgi:hypothetical protein